MSSRSRRYPPELKERADRMVFEHQSEYPSQWRAINQIRAKLGVHHNPCGSGFVGLRPMLATGLVSRVMNATG